MRKYRGLIIIPLAILLFVLMGITSFVMPKKEIIGTWVSKENPNYRLEFSENGICRDYYGGNVDKKYVYSISTTCGDNSAYRSLFIKIADQEGFFSKCYELKSVNKDNDGMLIIADTEKDEEYYYTKVEAN